MADFLTRLAERALGLAPVVQPILPSMFAPQPRLASDFSTGAALLPEESKETVEIQKPPVPASLEVASGLPAVPGIPGNPISLRSQDLSVPSGEWRVAEGPEKPPVGRKAVEIPAPFVPKLLKMDADSRAGVQRPIVRASPLPQEIHLVGSESRAAENQEKPTSSREQVSLPLGDDIQIPLGIPPREPSPSLIGDTEKLDSASNRLRDIRDYDHSKASGNRRSVGSEDQSSESTPTDTGKISPSPNFQVALQPVFNNSIGEPSPLRAAARIDVADGGQDQNKEFRLSSPRNLVPSQKLRRDPNSRVESLVTMPSAVRTNPTIRVTIGRVEVKAIMPPAPPVRPPSASRHAPRLSLEDYLKRRNRGER